ncbi:MAG: gephyrin-like molybdotransferase Glp, partial [Planctomycetota bacterium]
MTGSGPISLAEAETLVRAAVERPLPVEELSLESCHGRRLAADHLAPTPWPTTDRSAMDGFAVRAGAAGLAAGTLLRVVGECLAGHPFDGVVADGEAIRIMTGAVVPASVDAVVPVENTSGYAGSEVTLSQGATAGDHIRPQGSELAAGATVLSAGTRIRAAEIGVLAVLGQSRVGVYRRPRVAIVSTGDEVVPVDREPAPHQVRDSNSYALAAQVHENGGEPQRLGVAPDADEPLRAFLDRALADADVVLTIGGVSKGTHDLVRDALRALGVAERFWGIALKPGKPTYFGAADRADGRKLVIGLPGNPASCFTVFDLLVRPLLARLGGAPLEAPSPATVALGASSGAPPSRARSGRTSKSN